MSVKVEIVGAGLAGLVAAITLNRRGYRVIVYEGRDKIGGDLSYADSTLLNTAAVKHELGVNIEDSLQPWSRTRAWVYGKRYEFSNPCGVECYTVERGGGESSIENCLYRQALAEGVEVQLGRRVSREEFSALSPWSIIATGLDRESFEYLGIPYRPFYCHMATGKSDPSQPGVIIYLDRCTREFGYYFQAHDSAGALIFSVQKNLAQAEKELFRQKLYQNDGIKFDNWNDDIAAFAVWPLGSWRNRNLFLGNKILAGTLAGVLSPILNFGLNGALFSGKIAATAVWDRNRAYRDFQRLAPLYYPQFAFRKFREHAPHWLLKPVTRFILSTYHPVYFNLLMKFALWPPGYKARGRYVDINGLLESSRT